MHCATQARGIAALSPRGSTTQKHDADRAKRKEVKVFDQSAIYAPEHPETSGILPRCRSKKSCHHASIQIVVRSRLSSVPSSDLVIVNYITDSLHRNHVGILAYQMSRLVTRCFAGLLLLGSARELL